MLENIISKETIPADGVQRQWDIPFTFYKLADVGFYVSYDNGKTIEKITQNIRYEKDGNYFVYPTEESKLPILPVGATVLLLRETENKQLETSETFPFNSKDIERMADNLTMQIQDLKRDSLRSVKSSLFSEETGEEFAERFFEKADEAIESANKAQKSADDAERSNQESLLNAQNAASSAVLAASASESAREYANAAKSDADRAEAARVNNEEVLAAAEAFATRSETASEESKKHSEDAKQSVVDAEQFAIAAAASAESAKNSADLAEELIKDLDAGVYTKEEIDNKVIVIEADIDANADAIQKTRSDFMESDSELQQQINAHAEELTTQKNDIDELGDQVAGIESKIPEGTSDTNPLINKQQLLDEEMDIRSDFNESVSELQTQITAQASAIANKVDATGDTMTGALNLPELNVATSEGTLNLSITAGVATIATNNGLDIVSQTKFDTAPTTDDSTTWADALDTSLVRKAQVATAIAEAGGGASVPDNVYTKSNLLGGKDIDIVPEPVEGGIDEHTLACWHFDGKNTDEVNGLALEYIGISGNDPYDTNRMKFGTACIYDFFSSSLKTNDISSLNLTDTDWTLDLWFYQTNYQSSGSGKYGFQTSSKNLLGFKIYRYEIRLEGNMWGNSAGTSVATSTQTTWTHVALQYDHLNNKGYFFINGQKVYEGDVTDVTGQTFKDLYLGRVSGPSLLIDELRISNVLRWEEDFEVPTKAYEVPKPTGNMVVNFTGKAGGNGKNIGEVYYSQSSLASDNAGALPLWTGESVATAMYPSLTEWVTKHTELQCTAEEYESALTTYGECPKYVLSTDSLRLPKLTNYIKMANGIEGITQKEAGLPNITGSARPFADQEGTTATGPFTISAGSGNGGLENWTAQKVLNFDASLSNPIYGNSDTVTPSHTTLYPWVVAYAASIEASIAQAAEFQQGLSGKADANLGNIPTNYDYVVESYNDGTNWYRIYKSGWVEQGGRNNTSREVSLLLPMQNTQYMVLCVQKGTSAPTNLEGSPRAGAISTTQIYINGGAGNIDTVYYVCGQGAE